MQNAISLGYNKNAEKTIESEENDYAQDCTGHYEPDPGAGNPH